MVSIIVAIARRNVIGKSNDLPWYLPADLRHFKEVTVGHSVIMGRKTFESILARLGKPLPQRTNIVVTRDQGFSTPDVIITHSLEEAVKAAGTEEDVFIIGGAQIYQQALPLADCLYVTEVDADIDGDAFFPPITSEWREVTRESYGKDDKNPYNYAFVVYRRA